MKDSRGENEVVLLVLIHSTWVQAASCTSGDSIGNAKEEVGQEVPEVKRCHANDEGVDNRSREESF